MHSMPMFLSGWRTFHTRSWRRNDGSAKIFWKLETSKAIPNTERLTQPTAWSFGNAETLEAPGYCAIFFSIPWLFTQPQWLMVRNLFMFLIFLFQEQSED